MIRPGAFALLLTGTHLGAAGVGPAHAQSGEATVGFDLRVHESPAGALSYRLHVPATWAPARRLLVVLHGCTQGARDVAAGTGFNDLADRNGFAVLYPEQDPGAHPQRCWTWYDRVQQSADGPEPARILSLVRATAAELGVARGAVDLVGLSAGAAMAGILAVSDPGLFSGLALHSGIAFGAAGNVAEGLAAMQRGASEPPPGAGDPRLDGVVEADRPTRVLVLHGLADAVVAPRNAVQVAEQWASVFDARARRAGGTLKAADETVRVESGRPVRRRAWQDGGTEVVVLVAVEGLGHAWSGGDAAGTYTDPDGPSASAVILRYFGLAR